MACLRAYWQYLARGATAKENPIMGAQSTRTVTLKVEVALAPGGREMRRKRLVDLLTRQVEELQHAFDKNGYTVAEVTEATYESDRSDGRGHLWGSLI